MLGFFWWVWVLQRLRLNSPCTPGFERARLDICECAPGGWGEAARARPRSRQDLPRFTVWHLPLCQEGLRPECKNLSVALEDSAELLCWNCGAVVNAAKFFLGAMLHTRTLHNMRPFMPEVRWNFLHNHQIMLKFLMKSWFFSSLGVKVCHDTNNIYLNAMKMQ